MDSLAQPDPVLPSPAQVTAAWQQVMHGPGAADGSDLVPSAHTLLDGLPAIATGQIPDEAGQPLSLGRLTATFLSHPEAHGWQVVRDGAGSRPFLLELARRLLALGYVHDPYADEDVLLCPRRTAIDPDCSDAPLALARAVSAVERHSAAVLACVVARHLGGGGETSWLISLLDDPAAQCLLVSAFVAPDADRQEMAWLVRRVVERYEATQDNAWPAGALTTCCALGRLLARPSEPGLIERFRQQVVAWPGWHEAGAWPTRVPGGDLGGLKVRLTERVAAMLGVADCRLWNRAALAELLAGCWPPLLSFGAEGSAP